MGAGACKESTMTAKEGRLYALDRTDISIKGNFQKQNLGVD